VVAATALLDRLIQFFGLAGTFLVILRTLESLALLLTRTTPVRIFSLAPNPELGNRGVDTSLLVERNADFFSLEKRKSILDCKFSLFRKIVRAYKSTEPFFKVKFTLQIYSSVFQLSVEIPWIQISYWFVGDESRFCCKI